MNPDSSEKRSEAINAAVRALKVPAPNAETLALIAANAMRGTKTPADKAVRYAYDLWSEAHTLLAHGRYRHELERRGVPDNSGEFERAAKHIPSPKRFPATLADFFKLIIHGRTEADSTKRYRDFLKELIEKQDYGSGFFPADSEKGRARAKEIAGKSNEIDTKVGETLKRDKENGFKTKGDWCLQAICYRNWWEVNKSKTNSENARSKKSVDKTVARKI